MTTCYMIWPLVGPGCGSLIFGAWCPWGNPSKVSFKGLANFAKCPDLEWLGLPFDASALNYDLSQIEMRCSGETLQRLFVGNSRIADVAQVVEALSAIFPNLEVLCIASRLSRNGEDSAAYERWRAVCESLTGAWRW